RRWLAARVVLPLSARVSGRRLSSRLAHLQAQQWWSPDRIETDAVARLRGLLEHAIAHVPYYRRLLGEAGVRPAAIRSLGDLSRVPVSTKAALRAAGLEQTTAESLPASRRWTSITSGSSGMPFRFHFDMAAEDTRLATRPGGILASVPWRSWAAGCSSASAPAGSSPCDRRPRN